MPCESAEQGRSARCTLEALARERPADETVRAVPAVNGLLPRGFGVESRIRSWGGTGVTRAVPPAASPEAIEKREAEPLWEPGR